MAGLETTAVLALALLVFQSSASVSSAKLRVGDSFLIQEAEFAPALARSVAAGHQTMKFTGKNKGMWVDHDGAVVDSSNFQLFKNGSVLIKSATVADSGTYQKEPNPMIRIGDMGYAPPILIIQVQDYMF